MSIAELHAENAKLVAKREAIIADPKNANPAHAAGNSIWIYTPNARRRLDKLAWSITHNLMKIRQLESDGAS